MMSFTSGVFVMSCQRGHVLDIFANLMLFIYYMASLVL